MTVIEGHWRSLRVSEGQWRLLKVREYLEGSGEPCLQWLQRIVTTVDNIIYSSTRNTLLDVTLVIYNFIEDEGNII